MFLQKIEAKPATLRVQSRTQQKSFLFPLEEKIGRAQIRKSRENFFAGWRVVASGGGLASLVWFRSGISDKMSSSQTVKTHQNMNLQNKTIVVVGANGGIGSALVKELAKTNAKLILVAKVAPDSSFLSCDLTNKNELKNLTRKILAENSVIDALINCAGVGIYKSITELSEGEWETSINLNLSAPFLLTKQFLPALQKSELSLVLNIGSGMGIIPTKDRSAYCASKFGLRGLTLSLAEEFKNSKPHFCLITLGSTLTSFADWPVEEKLKLQKQGRAYFTPEWVAEKLVGIIKDESRTEEYTLYPGDYGQ